MALTIVAVVVLTSNGGNSSDCLIVTKPIAEVSARNAVKSKVAARGGHVDRTGQENRSESDDKFYVSGYADIDKGGVAGRVSYNATVVESRTGCAGVPRLSIQEVSRSR